MNYANTTASDVHSHNIFIIRHDGENQSIHTISHLWEPLTYPLFFPHATLGWGVVGSADEIESGQAQQSSQEEVNRTTRQIMHYQARILRE